MRTPPPPALGECPRQHSHTTGETETVPIRIHGNDKSLEGKWRTGDVHGACDHCAPHAMRRGWRAACGIDSCIDKARLPSLSLQCMHGRQAGCRHWPSSGARMPPWRCVGRAPQIQPYLVVCVAASRVTGRHCTPTVIPFSTGTSTRGESGEISTSIPLDRCRALAFWVYNRFLIRRRRALSARTWSGSSRFLVTKSLRWIVDMASKSGCHPSSPGPRHECGMSTARSAGMRFAAPLVGLLLTLLLSLALLGPLPPPAAAVVPDRVDDAADPARLFPAREVPAIRFPGALRLVVTPGDGIIPTGGPGGAGNVYCTAPCSGPGGIPLADMVYIEE
mmetsp:Transcript_33355/g.87491  ORF Transcript_33355/g.87491 Transcript_33355/m.87491 type:complete len:334 (+) Transcript_33355:1494-2495(+)